jgi:YVTN family beta-propeller protein
MMRNLSIAVCAVVACGVAVASGLAAAASPSHEVYVTNEISGDLSIINGDTLKVEATVPLGKRPRGIVTTHDGKHIYVASEDTGTAVVFDTASGKPVASANVGAEPEGVRVSPDGKFAYMTSESAQQVSIRVVAQRADLREVEESFRVRLRIAHQRTKLRQAGSDERHRHFTLR